MVKALLAHGAQVNALNDEEETPRFVALSCGKHDIAACLHEHGGVLLPDATPLQQAACEGEVETLNKLLQASPETRDTVTAPSNLTPLMLAALGGQLSAVNALLAAGADVNKTSRDGETALYFATAYGSAEIVQALLKGGAAVDPVHTGPDVLDPTPLLTDVYYLSRYPTDTDVTTRRLAIARDLLAHGANPNECSQIGGEGCPLHIAAKLGNLALAEMLLTAHASIDSRDRQGETPLCHAVEARQMPMVDFLVSHGADVNAADKHGRAVLQHARPEQPIYGFLVRHGAKISPQPASAK